MNIHLVKKQAIQNYIISPAFGKSSFEKWITVIKSADWKIPEDILWTSGSADLLRKGSDRVVFDIGGNNFRMICKYYFSGTMAHIFVCWIGTHAECHELCKSGQQFIVNAY